MYAIYPDFDISETDVYFTNTNPLINIGKIEHQITGVKISHGVLNHCKVYYNGKTEKISKLRQIHPPKNKNSKLQKSRVGKVYVCLIHDYVEVPEPTDNSIELSKSNDEEISIVTKNVNYEFWSHDMFDLMMFLKSKGFSLGIEGNPTPEVLLELYGDFSEDDDIIMINYDLNKLVEIKEIDYNPPAKRNNNSSKQIFKRHIKESKNEIKNHMKGNNNEH